MFYITLNIAGNDSGVDFARGEGNVYSSSSDDDDDSDNEEGDDENDKSISSKLI